MSGYVDPKEVMSPKKRVSGEIEVLVDKGERYWSLCKLTWDGESRIGIRWNGGLNSTERIGNPQSRGKPTWFILPEEVADVILQAVDDGLFRDVDASDYQGK